MHSQKSNMTMNTDDIVAYILSFNLHIYLHQCIRVKSTGATIHTCDMTSFVIIKLFVSTCSCNNCADTNRRSKY